MGQPFSTERSSGQPFNDQRVELFAHGLASGLSITVSASQANIHPKHAAKLRSHPEFVARMGELQTKMATVVTISLPAIAVELEKTAQEARGEKQYKAALECYRLLREMLKADADQLSGLGQSLPSNSSARRAELTRRLRGENPPPVDTTSDDDDEAAE
jgi:hypothetical protein